MPSTSIAIIADDLTGALDASAPFAGMAGGVTVATSPAALRAALALGSKVIAVSTRSRDLSAGEAREAVQTVLNDLPSGVQIIKKIDSRLKGNLAAELAPFGDAPLLVAPAIPEFGRFVRGGCLEGFGVAEPLSVHEALGPAAHSATIPDTTTTAEMRAAIDSVPPGAVLVGARGLCQALADRLGVPAVPSNADLPHPLCVAVGSTDPITLAQVARLRASGRLAYLPCPGGIHPAPGTEPIHDVTLLQATPGAEDRAQVVAHNLARTAGPILRDCRSMVLTGGATAEAVLDSVGHTVLRILGEALPGMPLCRAGEQLVVTKSGGFGTPDALLHLAGLTADVEG